MNFYYSHRTSTSGILCLLIIRLQHLSRCYHDEYQVTYGHHPSLQWRPHQLTLGSSILKVVSVSVVAISESWVYCLVWHCLLVGIVYGTCVALQYDCGFTLQIYVLCWLVKEIAVNKILFQLNYFNGCTILQSVL